MKTTVTPGETPAKITVSMIDQDLKNGISKPEMAIKYGIKPWEVDEMFKHPFLKGRRPSKKKPLSFIFEDDTEPLNSGDIAVEQAEEVDPNQMTLEDAIQDTIDEVKNIQENMEKTEKDIVNLLSPTDPDEDLQWKAEDSETGKPIELDQDAQDALNDAFTTMVNEDGKTLKETFDEELEDELGKPPSFEDTLDIVKEQQEEEELEMDDDTFEL